MRWKRLGCLLAALLIAWGWVGSASAPDTARAEAAAAITLTEEELAYRETHPTLKVGFVQDRVPVSFANERGELSGISRYIFDRVAELSGLHFEYAPLPGGSVTYDYLLGEDFDLVTSVEFNEENKKARGILISNPYLSSRKVVVAREDIAFSYSAPLSVAISTGSQTLRKVLGTAYPNFTLVDYDSIADCLDAVNNGEVDMTIQNQFVAEYWFVKPIYESLKVIPVLGMDDKLCFSAVFAFDEQQDGPSQEEGEILVSILDKAIAAMSEDEVGSYTIQGILENQYQFSVSDFLYRYRYAVGILGAALFVIVVLAALLMVQRMRSVEARADARAKEQFLSTMSHEIRTPLHGLIGLNYLMFQKLDDRARMTDYLRQSTTTAKYLMSLVDDILDMSKLESEEMTLASAPVDLPLVVSTVSAIVRGSMEERELTFETQTDLPWPCVLGDEVRIQQVLLNLLDNARKFTQPGGRVRLILTQETAADGRVLTRAVVEDNGRGMSEEFQKRAFRSFAQELDTVSKGNQGTGLGLPISRDLAQLMGGDLTVVSKKGEGSRFTFTFLGEKAEMPREETDAPKPVPSAKPRVLVAEDNELNAEIMLEMLDGEGFEAEWAKDGREALECFSVSAAGTYGVILMDLLMPEMDGYQATQAIRALKRPDARTVRIIACTANAFAQDRERAFQAGMDAFIAKPVNMEELLGLLANLPPR